MLANAPAQSRAVGPTGATLVVIRIVVQALNRNDFLSSRACQLQRVLGGWSRRRRTETLLNAPKLRWMARRTTRPSGPTLDAGKYGAESNRGARDDGIEISGRSSLIKKFDQPPTTLGALLGEPTDLASAVKTTGYWHYRRAGGPVTSNGKDDSARHDDRCDANGHPVLESWIRLTPRFK